MKDSKYFKEAGTINETWLLQVVEELLAAEYFRRKVWCRLLVEYKLQIQIRCWSISSVLRLKWK